MTIGFSQIDKYYGGCGNEYAKDFILTKDGFNILGVSNSFDWGDGDIYEVMIDSSGNTKWAKTYRIDQKDETPSEIISWNDNLKIILGGNGNGWHKPYLMAIDSFGQRLWSKENQQYRFRHVIKSKSNELVACGDFIGSGDFPPAILTLDSLGNLISSKYFLFSPEDPITSEGFYTNKIIQDKDSNYVMTGGGFVHAPGSFVKNVLFIIKLNKNKNLLWSKVFDYGANNVANLINSTDNSYILSGNTHQAAFVMKLDTSGNVIWLKEFSLNAIIADFIETTDDKYLLLTQSSKLIKLDNQGSIMWGYQYDSTNYYNVASKVLEFSNDYYLLKTSLSNSISVMYSPQNYKMDILIVKIDTSGNSTFKQVIPNISSITVNTNTFNYNFVPIDSISSFNSIIFSEKTVSSAFSNSLDCVNVGVNNITTSIPSVNIFPNPNLGTFNIEFPDNLISSIKIEIYNIFGSLIQEIEVSDKKNLQVNLQENQKGLFIVKISYNNYLSIFKINCF